MFTVVTDSSVYIPRKEGERLGIKIAPLLYSVYGQTFCEGYADENGRYRELLSQGGAELRTAQVSSASFMSLFSELLRKNRRILCLTLSSRLSGTYSSAMLAARELDRDRILVLDSLTTGGGLRFLCEKACELSQEGLTLQEAADELERARERIGIMFSVDDMEALRRSGRLGFVRQSVGTILNMRPILSCTNGTVVSGGVVRGQHAQISALSDSVPEDACRILVHYINKQSQAEALVRALKEKFSCEIRLCEVGPVLGIHLGLSVVGVAWERE